MRDPIRRFETTCFVVSPFGHPGTPDREGFRRVLDECIRPAVAESGLGLDVVRADDIHRPGSFVRDVLAYLAGAHTVIADLTGRNANVFYELGVRHALSPRTLLIAQDADDIPSDLREYRTLLYDPPPHGTAACVAGIRKYLEQVAAEPERPDNPVLDRLQLPRVPDDLRQTYAARRISIGRQQAGMLLHIERTAARRRSAGGTGGLSEHELRVEFRMGGTEMYYRLEQLRLLGFVDKRRTPDGTQFEYDLSEAYWKELGV
jgi:hypothetical protein